MKRDDHASWMQAQEYASQIGKIPNVFSAAVRLLLNDQLKNSGVLRPATKYLVGHALRGKKILAMFYYSTAQLKPEALKSKDYIGLGDLVALYQPYDVAVLYGLYLLYRRALARIGIQRESVRKILPNFHREVQIGGIVGAAIPRIGIGNGLLAGSVHHLGLLMIALVHSREVKLYNEHLASTKQKWDLHYEVAKFGCTSLQVGSVLLTKLGFGRKLVETYIGALDQDLGLGDPSTGILYPIHYARHWIDGISAKLEQPLQSLPGEFYPLAGPGDWMRSETAIVEEENLAWIERDSDDVSPELTPALFSVPEESKEVPEQLRDIFSLKEITEMDEDEFDALIDQIDKSIVEGTADPKAEVLKD